MSLIGDGKLLILDEPTSNLDLRSREKIWNLIKKLVRNRDLSILISTQHIEEADYIGTRVCILKNGKMHQCDSPENLKRMFGTGFKVKMIADWQKHAKYLKTQQEDVKQLFQRKIMDAQVFEGNEIEQDEDWPRYVKKDRNMEVLIPHKDSKDVPEFLIDFIENDPNFIPEIHCNNLEDAFMNMHLEEKVTLHNST